MPGSLQEYKQKRDFSQTSEPAGTVSARRAAKAAEKSGGGHFVIHKHAASRLHYDLRLEHEGVLWSWAVTKGPSLDPSAKRLAVHVEDHPLAYGDFEGMIPKGSYGAGSVIVWDNGTWLPDASPAAGLKKGHLSFELKGQKLKGKWHLVRLKPRTGEKRDNWLLMKVDDAFAVAGGDILQSDPQSVKSGRTNEDVAGGKADGAPAVVRRAPARKGKAKLAPATNDAAWPTGFIPPALATLQSSPPEGSAWIQEVKFDGYRIQAHVANGRVRLLTRSGLDWTPRFGEALKQGALSLKCKNAVIDGEIVVLSDKGMATFSLLQADLSAGRSDRMVYYAFDLMALNGVSQMEQPLHARKRKLENLLAKQPSNAVIRYSEGFEDSGKLMLSHACRMGLEGVISKRRDAPYQSGRTLSWIKSKCVQRQEFIILGFLNSAAIGRGLRSIIVGYRKNGKIIYAGRVGTGFGLKTGDDLRRRLDKLKTGRPAVPGLELKEKAAIWVKPELVAEIAFRGWTADGILRQAAFVGLREDKPASDVIRETPVRPSRAKTKGGAEDVATSLRITNPSKVLWPAADVSKESLLHYYQTVWPRMEKFVVNRPLSLLRAPDGIEGQRFFQKHGSSGMADAIHVFRDPLDNQEHIYIQDFEGLAALVQLGVVEIHIWGARIDALETPDQVVFDLDPDEGLVPQRVRDAALECRTRLKDLGFASFVKTSGGKGFHVVMPLKPAADWTTVKTFAHQFADALAQSAPTRFTSTLAKKARKGLIFVDYLRNGRGATTVAPFSTRANAEAAISMPVEWSDVEKGLNPRHFTVSKSAILKNFLTKGDPWKRFFSAPKPLRK